MRKMNDEEITRLGSERDTQEMRIIVRRHGNLKVPVRCI